MPIERLAEELTHKIAAGEVIDRPASVVKELVENAIDAGSHTIELDVGAGGLTSIAVRDDGLGMSEADLRLCGERHATSKIRTEDDLLSIATLGFRGEAIASIAAVSRLRITSRSSSGDVAHALSIEGGTAAGLAPAARAPGTTVEVRDLFFNLPARAKFLGTPRTEALHINRVVQRFALVLPDVGFVLAHDGREVFAAPRVSSFLDRISQVYGTEVARGMIPLDGRRGEIRIFGCISRPDLKRGNRRDQLFVVNGRLVGDRGLGYVLASAYRGILRPGSFPIAVVCVDLPRERVDVNVHPRKEEVRFSNVREVQDALGSALHQALSSPNRAIPVGVRTAELSARTAEPTPPWVSGVPRLTATGSRPLPLDLHEQWIGSRIAQEAGKVRVESDRRVVGQLHDMYLLVEAPEGLEIVDQHIAHERILYERLKAEAADAGIVRQLFLLPARIELPFEAAAVLSANLAVLERVGVVLEEFGGGTFLLREYPQRLADEQTPRGFQGVVEALVERLREEVGVEETLYDAVLRELACGAAIKAGERLSLIEAQALVDQLMECANPYSCPHGRPIIVKLDRDELDRKFGRG